MEKPKATKYMAASQVEHWVLSSSDFVSNLCLCLFHHFAPLSCLYLPGKKLLCVVFGKRLLLAGRHLMLYCSALCLSYQSGSIADAPPPPELPEINGHCEQNRAIPRENAPEENICQSFGAKSNCDSRRPRFAPYPQLGLTSRLCQSFASKFDFKAILKQRICLSIRPPQCQVNVGRAISLAILSLPSNWPEPATAKKSEAVHHTWRPQNLSVTSQYKFYVS